jgi:Activator of Hsp90 ATPase homolog 1-like protein
MAEAEPPSELRLHLAKTFVVPQECVFAAFVDAEQLRRWWGPAGFTVPDLQFDPVEGADYRIVMQLRPAISSTFAAASALSSRLDSSASPLCTKNLTPTTRRRWSL